MTTFTPTRPTAPAVLPVPLRDIRADDAINPRAGGTDEEAARQYAADMEAGDVFPPGVAYRDRDGVVWLSQGFTRRRACELADRPSMTLEVRPGDRRAAAIDAAGANRSHGQRRTNADKRRAVEIVLAVEPGWSDRRVADCVGVHHDLVSDVRRGQSDDRQLADSASSSSSDVLIVGADGRVRSAPHQAPKAPPAPAWTPPLPDPRTEMEAALDVACGVLDALRVAAEAAGDGRLARKAAACRLGLWGRRPAGLCPTAPPPGV